MLNNLGLITDYVKQSDFNLTALAKVMLSRLKVIKRTVEDFLIRRTGIYLLNCSRLIG